MPAWTAHGWCAVGGVIDAFVENPLRVAANFAGDETMLVRFSRNWKGVWHPVLLLLRPSSAHVGPAALFRPSDQQDDLLSLVSVPNWLIGCWGCSCIDMHQIINSMQEQVAIARSIALCCVVCRVWTVLRHNVEHLLLAWHSCTNALPAKEAGKYDLQCEPCTSCCTCDR